MVKSGIKILLILESRACLGLLAIGVSLTDGRKSLDDIFVLLGL
jgi:hypothetical protein